MIFIDYFLAVFLGPTLGVALHIGFSGLSGLFSTTLSTASVDKLKTPYRVGGSSHLLTNYFK
jgi:hypothetical protein